MNRRRISRPAGRRFEFCPGFRIQLRKLDKLQVENDWRGIRMNGFDGDFRAAGGDAGK